MDGTKERELTICSWNVNGLRAVLRKGNLLDFLEKKSSDVLCLQEIKARPEQILKTDLRMLEEKYQIFWNPAERGGYSGTATLVRKDLSAEKLEAKVGILDEEGRVLGLRLGNIILVNVYTPNSKGDLSRLNLRFEEWDPKFLEMLKRLEGTDGVSGVVTCGDFNAAHKEIDLARPEANHKNAGFTDEEREGVTKLLRAGFLDTFREMNGEKIQYTWWSARQKARERNVGWRIDYFFISEKLRPRLVEAKIFEQVLGSDHCPVMIKLRMPSGEAETEG